MAQFQFTKTREKIEKNTVDLDNVTLGVALLKAPSAYTAQKDVDEFMSDIGDELTTGEVSNYTRKTLAGKTVTRSGGKVTLDATDPLWSSLASGGTFTRAVVFVDRGGADSANELLNYYDLPAPIATNGQDYTLNINAAGLSDVDTAAA